MHKVTQVYTKQQHFTQDHLISLYNIMTNNSDLQNANKIIDLFEKLTKNELVIAFSGHFSAGKSSMINSLFGKDILPNSPIPTSANIVKITSGGNSARIFFHNDLPIEYKEPYDFEMIKQYCQDKDTIKRIEININDSLLSNGCAIIDTPGIDAANDADRFMTESSLYLVDLMFYVMDYNHVQSEVNLKFLKTLQEKNIPVIIIINQIDKHNEAELTFQSFKDSFNKTLKEWQIQPVATYYSSLKDSEAIHNEFPEIKKHLISIFMTNKNNLINIDHSVQQLIHDHKVFLQENLNEKLAQYLEDVDNEVNLLEIETLEEKLAESSEKINELQTELQTELNITLRNAYLMPASLRDQAKLFLESQQKGFRLGLFTTKRRREDVKLKRANDFLKSLQQNIDSSIEWQLRDKFLRILKKYTITDQALLLNIQRLTINYTTEHLTALVNKGATINGNFILNYTNEVAEDVKNKFKKEANLLFQKVCTVYKEEIDQQVDQYEVELKKLTQIYEQQQKRIKAKNELEEAYEQIQTIQNEPTPSEQNIKLFQAAIKTRNDLIKEIKVMETPAQIKKTEQQVNNKQDLVRKKTTENNTTTSILTKIDETIRTIEALPGFQTIIDDLKDKQQRLNNRLLTISLFGAFSAGKSSFANSLMGANVLPVSPNPTTATITRISPVTEKNTHGTVVIHLKDEQELVKDLLEITKEFSPVETRLTKLLRWIQNKNIHQNDRLNKTYQSYLNAIILGFDYSKEKIGKTIKIQLSDFASYVTDEKKACYIESVDLYYQCSITKQGITIVDTPGADSINARHTNVAFDYIKQTDAILYVTYYNHALSRADKNFLMQLGRVKDSFELDKMFFIINAADLAKDNEELQLVENYVKDELLKLNIRLPRVYPVSSKQSLVDKLQNKRLNGAMETFEKSFYEFINNDLAALMKQSAILDMERAYKSINNYVRTIDLDEAEVKRYQIKLTDQKNKKLKLVSEANYIVYEEQISGRIDTQLYYVKQRLSIRFNDLFKDAFNPTTISGTGKQAQEKLVHSLKYLLDETAYELLQELRAVSLRVEATMKKLMNEFYEQIQNELHHIDDSFTLPAMEPTEFDSPRLDEAFKSIDYRLFDQTLRQFKGTKSFFVNNERDQMKEAIYNILVPFIKEYVNSSYQIMERLYIDQWNKAMTLVQKQLQTSVQGNFQQSMAMTTNNVNKHEIIEKQQILKEIIQAVHIKDDINEKKYTTS